MAGFWSWVRTHCPEKGTLPQWIGATATVVGVSAAIYGLTEAAPIFQNKKLTEENARLQVELDDDRAALLKVRATSWDVVCNELAARVQVVIDTSTFVWRLYARTETLADRPTFLAVEGAPQNGRELLERQSANETFHILLDEDTGALKSFIDSVITAGGPAMDETIQLPGADRPMTAAEVAGREALLLRLHQATSDLEPRCQAANPARSASGS
ncbi:MAG: hypothetical protein AB7V53_11115 [Dongiaceae bacterium]